MVVPEFFRTKLKLSIRSGLVPVDDVVYVTRLDLVVQDHAPVVLCTGVEGVLEVCLLYTSPSPRD